MTAWDRVKHGAKAANLTRALGCHRGFLPHQQTHQARMLRGTNVGLRKPFQCSICRTFKPGAFARDVAACRARR
jgi:hypothetical protein